MKKSSKLITVALSAAALFFAGNVKAQTTKATDDSKLRLGIGVEAGIPTGNAHNVSDFELGGTARLQYDADKSFAITLTSGYYNMFGKDIPGTNVKYQSLGIVPLKAGIKAFFASDLYFGAEAGAGFETNSGGGTKFIVSPALGFANKTWDVGVRYENFSGQGNNYGLVGLRLAYAFGL
ncbi:MAG: hypothetical protein JWR02_26 [Mucilaginibacter sp.]|nr:hypothetical protein [Mucilaginibacter sp.]